MSTDLEISDAKIIPFYRKLVLSEFKLACTQLPCIGAQPKRSKKHRATIDNKYRASLQCDAILNARATITKPYGWFSAIVELANLDYLRVLEAALKLQELGWPKNWKKIVSL